MINVSPFWKYRVAAFFLCAYTLIYSAVPVTSHVKVTDPFILGSIEGFSPNELDFDTFSNIYKLVGASKISIVNDAQLQSSPVASSSSSSSSFSSATLKKYQLHFIFFGKLMQTNEFDFVSIPLALEDTPTPLKHLKIHAAKPKLPSHNLNLAQDALKKIEKDMIQLNQFTCIELIFPFSMNPTEMTSIQPLFEKGWKNSRHGCKTKPTETLVVDSDSYIRLIHEVKRYITGFLELPALMKYPYTFRFLNELVRLYYFDPVHWPKEKMLLNDFSNLNKWIKEFKSFSPYETTAAASFFKNISHPSSGLITEFEKVSSFSIPKQSGTFSVVYSFSIEDYMDDFTKYMLSAQMKVHHAVILKDVHSVTKSSVPRDYHVANKTLATLTSEEEYVEFMRGYEETLASVQWYQLKRGLTFVTTFASNLKWKYEFRPTTKETTFKTPNSESVVVTNVLYHTVVEEFRYLNDTDYQGVALPLSVSMKGFTVYLMASKDIQRFHDGFPISFLEKMLQTETTAFLKVTIPSFYFKSQNNDVANSRLNLSPTIKLHHLLNLERGEDLDTINMLSIYRICADMKGDQLTKDLFEPNFLKEMIFNQAFYVALVDDRTKGVVVQFPIK